MRQSQTRHNIWTVPALSLLSCPTPAAFFPGASERDELCQGTVKVLSHTEHPALSGMSIMSQRSLDSRGCTGRADGKKSFYEGEDNKKLNKIKFGERKLSVLGLTLFRGSSQSCPSGSLFLNNY